MAILKMGGTLRDIAKGLLSGELPPISSAELAHERIKVCQECPAFRKMIRQCSICGCMIDLKTKLLEAKCPTEQW